MNNTLQNGFTILEYLAADAEECSVKELAEHFGLPNSHVCRLLKTLADTGYVEQTPGSRKYRISLKILNLSNMRLKKLKLRNIARPYLQKLVRELKRPVFLTAPYRYRSLIVATEYPERFAGDAGVVVGQIHPVNRSACGKICAAYAPEEALDELLAGCDWSRKTEQSITDPARFREELKTIRACGFSRMEAEFDRNTGAVGAPVFIASRELAGAVGVILPEDASLWTPELRTRFIDATKSCGESISFALGCPLE